MKQLSLFILSAAISLLASCIQNQLPGGTPSAGTGLYVDAAIMDAGSHTGTEIVTRAANDAVPVTKGSLGIFRSQSVGYASAAVNKQYTYTGGEWQPATDQDVIYLNGDNADVCAYYPYNNSYVDKAAIPLISGRYTGTADTHDPNDLCYDIDRTMNGVQCTTTFGMKHALAWLEFSIAKETGYTAECHITSIIIQNPEMIATSTIDITDGTYSIAPVKGTVTYNPGPDVGGIQIEATPITTGALLVPFTPTAAGLSVSFTVNGTPMTITIACAAPAGITKVEAGHRYTVKLTVKATSIQVTGVDMMPWVETGVGGDDCIWYPTQDPIP